MTDAFPNQATKDHPLYEALVDFLFQLADDELCVGHRNAEWLGLAPAIEEDVAFASIAQEELGHATHLYQLLCSLGEGPEDDLAFKRPQGERRNAIFTEVANGDWAQTIVRQYYFNVFEEIRWETLSRSTYQPLADISQKMMAEEYYHVLHLETRFRQFAKSSGEALARFNHALVTVQSSLPDLFHLGIHESTLVESGICPRTSAELYEAWRERLASVMASSAISVPEVDVGSQLVWNGRIGRHTNDLHAMLETMNEVARLEEASRW